MTRPPVLILRTVGDQERVRRVDDAEGRTAALERLSHPASLPIWLAARSLPAPVEAR
jgi:hypothetical protein